MEASKCQTMKLTKMLEVGWSLPEILLLRACHTYTLLAPYARGNEKTLANLAFQTNISEKLVISTPVCVHYGEFNTGKTSLLQCLAAMHGIRNGKVHREFVRLCFVLFYNRVIEFQK